MKKTKAVIGLALSVAMISTSISPAFAEEKKVDYGSAKNIILMIPDGMNIESSTTARWMTEDFTLHMDDMATGLIRTNNSNTPIADSAPAGTAMSTGVKTQSPYIATYPGSEGKMPGAEKYDEKKKNMPLATVLEAAERQGRSTGIVSTSNVQHATPADFSSHYPNRNEYQILSEQQVYQNMEIVLGAGSKHIEASNRKDKEDLVQVLKDKGYDYVTNTDELKRSKSEKIWGMFASSAMDYDIDRDPKKQPSLAEMTQKSLEVLSKNEKGFFLMVEGSEIDWANHANDAVGVISDILAFDKAVGVAKEFAQKNPGTAIIVASDHGTGGLSFGEYAISSGYDKVKLPAFIEPLKRAKLSGQGAGYLLNNNRTNVKEVMEEVYGITDLSNEEIQSIVEAEDLQYAIGPVVSKRAYIGFTTNGHVGGDVALYSYVNGDGLKPLTGTVHNCDVGKYIENLLDADLNELTKALYQDAIPAFRSRGAMVELKDKSSANPVLVVSKGFDKIEFPMNKNIAIVNGKTVELDGLVIFNGERVFMPKTAIDLIKY